MRALLDDALGAFGLLTRLPVPAPDADEAGDVDLEATRSLARGVWAWPLVGAVVGAIGALVWLAAQLAGLGLVLAAGLAVAAQVLVTGALHEDGLADFADGLGGGRTREHALAIMRDSRIGSYGVIALVMVLGLRWGAVAGLPLDRVLGGLICAGALGRLAMAALPAFLSPARPDGLGVLVATPPKRALLAALVIAVLIVALHLSLVLAVMAFAAAALAAGVTALLARRAIGGYTGDLLGAAGLVAETAALLVLAAG